MTLQGQVRNSFPSFRVFIYGQEVTDDVASVTVNWADNTRAPSTAQITLSNALDRYTTTREDIFALFPADLDPQNVNLAELRKTLLQDPLVEGLIYGQSPLDSRAALQQLLGVDSNSDVNAAARRQSVVQQFREEYVTRVRDAREDLNRQILDRVQGINDPVKKRVIESKFTKIQQVSQPDFTETGTAQLDSPDRANRLLGQAFAYPFWAARCIFHTGDPVRIFMADAANPRIWYYAFTGFVSDWTRSRTDQNVRNVIITCEDVLRLFRFARITTNPGIFDIEQAKEDEDFAIRTFFNDDFSRLTLVELVYLIAFGPNIPELTPQLLSQANLTPEDAQRIQGADPIVINRHSVNGSSQTFAPRYGVGSFDFDRSVTFIFGPTAEGDRSGTSSENTLQSSTTERILKRAVRIEGSDALGLYQAAIDHQVRPSDLESMDVTRGLGIRRAGLPTDPSTGAPDVAAVVEAIGENPHLYPVDGGRVMILAPASLGPNSNRHLLNLDFKGVETTTTFKNRLFVLYNVIERIEFSFYATPKGDLIVEMPLYDFDPSDFGETPIAYTQANAALVPDQNAKHLIESIAKEARGPFAPHYRIAEEDTGNIEQTFTDESIRTQYKCTWHNLQNMESGSTGEAIGLSAQFARRRALYPQFGVRVELAEAPLFVASPEGAQVYAELQLNKQNARALTSKFDALPQLRIGPNRPLEIAEGPYMATSRAVTRQIDVGSRSYTQTLATDYTRVWTGQVDENNNPIYEPLGGLASRPLNYGALFKNQLRNTPTSKARGVSSTPQTPGTGDNT